MHSWCSCNADYAGLVFKTLSMSTSMLFLICFIFKLKIRTNYSKFVCIQSSLLVSSLKSWSLNGVADVKTSPPPKGSRPSNFDDRKKDSKKWKTVMLHEHLKDTFESGPDSCLFYLLFAPVLKVVSPVPNQRLYAMKLWWHVANSPPTSPSTSPPPSLLTGSMPSNFDGGKHQTTNKKQPGL